jgi:hypothetical protein
MIMLLRIIHLDARPAERCAFALEVPDLDYGSSTAGSGSPRWPPRPGGSRLGVHFRGCESYD